MRTRLIGAVLAIVLAALGAVVLMSYVRSADQRAVAGARTVEVLVVGDLILAGTPAAELPDLVTTASVPANAVVGGGVTSLDQLAGLVSTVDLLPGEQLLSSRFAEVVEETSDSIVEVPEGLQEVTLALDAQRALGGHVSAGLTVGVFVSGTVEGIGQSTHLVLHKVLITRVQGLEAPPVVEPDVPEAIPIPSSVLVTFAVSAADAERIVFGAEYGTLWLSQESAAADGGGTSVQTWESVYG